MPKDLVHFSALGRKVPRSKCEALRFALLETVRLVLEKEVSEDDDRFTSGSGHDHSAHYEAVVGSPSTDCDSDSPYDSFQSPKKSCRNRIPGGPCNHCGATESPQWRRPLTRNILLCNACGIYYSRHNSFPHVKIPARKSGRALDSGDEWASELQFSDSYQDDNALQSAVSDAVMSQLLQHAQIALPVQHSLTSPMMKRRVGDGMSPAAKSSRRADQVECNLPPLGAGSAISEDVAPVVFLVPVCSSRGPPTSFLSAR